MTPATTRAPQAVAGVEIRAPLPPRFAEVLTPAALAFLAELQRRCGARRLELLARRQAVQAEIDAGTLPDFLPETADIRSGAWRVAPLPPDLLDRRVEITGPADSPKMVINALNSGARVFMADFEDSSAPTWTNLLEGQINLRAAVAGTIEHVQPGTGKVYRLGARTAVLFARPRGWHLPEAHVRVDGQAMSGSLFDAGLYLFHNAKALLARGTGPYLYLPKLQSHLEARLWNDVFVAAERALSLPAGSIKATVLIETLPAAFEMDEILWELRERSAGLNCGRWDYIFSFIKTLRAHAGSVLPDRAQVGMTQPCLRSYSQLLIATCHRRGVHAMGGMAAQIPIKDDAERNRLALEQVEADKRREVGDGHDGTWVAHPGLVELASRLFDAGMPGPHQIHRLREDVSVRATDLLAVPVGTLTEAGLRQNVNVGVAYLAAWLEGTGCVPLYDLMEDAATAEISRTQIWQGLRHGARLVDGRRVTVDLVRSVLEEELVLLGRTRRSPRLAEAAALFLRLATADTCPDFLTLPAYDALVASESLSLRDS